MLKPLVALPSPFGKRRAQMPDPGEDSRVYCEGRVLGPAQDQEIARQSLVACHGGIIRYASKAGDEHSAVRRAASIWDGDRDRGAVDRDSDSIVGDLLGWRA